MIGRIHRESPILDALIAPDPAIEKLAEGFVWTEGPVWIREDNCLLFSDVPANKMYRWSDAEGVSIFLDPSGYDGPDPSAFREPGSNGLIREAAGSILMCDHGNRAVARLDLVTKTKTFLATHFEGKRFNSPNDLALASDGTIYFTDPPYGLEGLNGSPLKEIPFNGIYRIDPEGDVTLIDKEMSFPNGIILSPDERTLYVANSDPDLPNWIAFSLGEGRREVFASSSTADGPGLPDGMAVDVHGNLFATGPGGVQIFTPAGERIGLIETGTAIANCAFGDDGRMLYLASHHMIARLPTITRGHGF